MTLDDVPLDAEYEGFGPLFLWDAERKRWVSWRIAEFRAMTPEVKREPNGTNGAGAAWDQVAKLAERIRVLLLYAGFPVACQRCRERIVWVRDASGNGKGFNPDGAVHDETCAKPAPPAGISGPLFSQGGD